MSGPNNPLRVSLVQFEIAWEDPLANCALLEEKLQHLANQTDVVVLPEMFSTGFSMNDQGAEIGHGQVIKWLKVMANRLNALVVGSIKCKENNQYFNRFVAVDPESKILSYDKKHLFRMGGEDQFYTAGNQKRIISYKNWNIAAFVCYDLRFPVWSRNVDLAYDLAIYVANWPAVRSHAWNTLLRARAIENLAYVVGVNRIGRDGNEIQYQGDSALISYLGDDLLNLSNEDSIKTYSISKLELIEFRAKFPTDLDADHFTFVN
jgi:predicted amidohydrolase